MYHIYLLYLLIYMYIRDRKGLLHRPPVNSTRQSFGWPRDRGSSADSSCSTPSQTKPTEKTEVWVSSQRHNFPPAMCHVVPCRAMSCHVVPCGALSQATQYFSKTRSMVLPSTDLGTLAQRTASVGHPLRWRISWIHGPFLRIAELPSQSRKPETAEKNQWVSLLKDFHMGHHGTSWDIMGPYASLLFQLFTSSSQHFRLHFRLAEFENAAISCNINTQQ